MRGIERLQPRRRGTPGGGAEDTPLALDRKARLQLSVGFVGVAAFCSIRSPAATIEGSLFLRPASIAASPISRSFKELGLGLFDGVGFSVGVLGSIFLLPSTH
jgi:hypothetical protein